MKNYDMAGLRGMVEQMPTEQLDEMLKYELEKEPVDEAAVKLIMGILEERDQDVQVEMNERTAGESYFRNPFKSIYYMISVALSIIFVQ